MLNDVYVNPEANTGFLAGGQWFGEMESSDGLPGSTHEALTIIDPVSITRVSRRVTGSFEVL